MANFIPEIDKPFTVRGTEIVPDEAAERYLQKLARIAFDEMFQMTGLLAPDGTLLECNRATLERSRPL